MALRVLEFALIAPRRGADDSYEGWLGAWESCLYFCLSPQLDPPLNINQIGVGGLVASFTAGNLTKALDL